MKVILSWSPLLLTPLVPLAPLQTDSSSAFDPILNQTRSPSRAPLPNVLMTTLCPLLHLLAFHTMQINIGPVICHTFCLAIHVILGIRQTGSIRPLVPTLIWHLHNPYSEASIKTTHPKPTGCN
jgi:hypothetical protein